MKAEIFVYFFTMMYPHCLVHSWCLKNTCWINECLPNLSTEFQTWVSNRLLLTSTRILNRCYFKCPIQPYTHTTTCFPHFPVSIHGVTTFQVKPQTQESPPSQPTAFPSEPGQITAFNSKIDLSIFFLCLWSLLRHAAAFSPVGLLLSSYPTSFKSDCKPDHITPSFAKREQLFNDPQK